MKTLLPVRVTRGLQPLFSREPFVSLREEMDDLLGRFTSDWDDDWITRGFSPSLDLSETDDSVEVRMDVPGVEAEEIEIEVTGNTLRIIGKRKEEQEEKGKSFHRIERRAGSFARSLTLPCAVKEGNVQAECHEGVLTVTLPKCEEAKTHKIKVKTSGK